ncbi:MAG: hypothetical protein ACXWT1_10055 [Methylobacter sp.]
MTAKAGTGRPQAANTDEPTEPGRTQTRQPKADTDRAKTEASANEPNGTNRQAGAGDQPPAQGKARRAHTQPQDNGRAVMPAPRDEPTTETKPAITHPQHEETHQSQSHPQTAAGAAEGPPGAGNRDGRDPKGRPPRREGRRHKKYVARSEHGCKGRSVSGGRSAPLLPRATKGIVFCRRTPAGGKDEHGRIMTGMDAALLERRDARTGTARMRMDSNFKSDSDFCRQLPQLICEAGRRAGEWISKSAGLDLLRITRRCLMRVFLECCGLCPLYL